MPNLIRYGSKQMAPRRKSARRIAFGISLLTLFLGSGCSSSTGSSGDQAEPEIDVRPITSSKQIVLPVSSFVLSAADEKAYFQAVNLQQRECAEGFNVDTSIPVAVQPSQMELASPRRVGLIDADDVARYGYDLPPSPDGAIDDKANGWNPGDREQLIMNGIDASGAAQTVDPVTGRDIPDGGCAQEGFRLVDKGDTSPARNDLVLNLLNDAWSLTTADSRALAAAEEWAACMEKQGYTFKTRADAGNSVLGQPKDVQLRMAKLDLQCAVETDYNSIWYAVDSAYEKRLIGQHEGELQANLAEQREVMDRVHDMLRAGG